MVVIDMKLTVVSHIPINLLTIVFCNSITIVIIINNFHVNVNSKGSAILWWYSKAAAKTLFFH